MIVKKDWVRYKPTYENNYAGIFLFGFIPIYIERHRVYYSF